MDNEILKINILSITISGLLMLVAGIGLYFFKAHLASNIRYFLPIPPIAVASYIFVFNVFKHYNANVPKKVIVVEMLHATAISAFFFFFFTVVMMGLIWLLKDL